MKTFVKVPIVLLLLCLFSLVTVSCFNSSAPIERISMIKAPNDNSVPTAVDLNDPGNDPMPTVVFDFSLGSKLYVGVRLNKNLKEAVTFTKFTIFNEADSTEVETGTVKELGPYEPGQEVLLNVGDKWTLPSEIGHYEFRIYLDKRVVSKVFFDIVE